MTTTADETAQAAAEAARAAIAEVTGELGSLRIAALVRLAQGRALIDEAGKLAITADLADEAAEATERLAAARTAREAAEEAIRPVQETLDRLEAELADCRGRAGNISTVIADDADLTARIEARSLAAAFREETEDLTARIAMITGTMLTPLGQQLMEARRAESQASIEAADLVGAAEDPLGHPRSRSTEGFRIWLEAGGGAEILTRAKPGSPGWAQARAWLTGLLETTGIGAHLQAEAVRAFRAGDPAMLAIGGSTTRVGDQTVIYDPSTGRPPVVLTGAATRQQLDSAAPGHGPDTSPASTVMQQAWGQIQHQTSPGLYVHP